MSHVTVIGVDLAKTVFQVHGEDKEGQVLFSRRLSRRQFKDFMKKTEPCLVGLEACGTAHYWARELESFGHQAKLINPRRVKAYVIGNKNDANDAQGICEAARSPKVRAIPIKTLAQQDLTLLHNARRLLVKKRTQLVNHLRSQLAEYGVIAKQGHKALRQVLGEVLGGELIHFTGPSPLFVFSDLKGEWDDLDKRLNEYQAQIKRVVKENSAAKKLMTLPGVGEITATAVIAKVADFNCFNKGSDFSASLGLTPKEYASAQKRRLGSISKQCDRYIRTLLIHGARSAIRATLNQKKMGTTYHRWIHQLVERVGKNKAAVALANKHARMIWALLKHDREVDLNDAMRFLKGDELTRAHQALAAENRNSL